MRLISVIHILCALVVAAVAAPVDHKSLSAGQATEKHVDTDQSTDVFQPIEVKPVSEIPEPQAISEEVDPVEDSGCIVA
ncbi:hypothetical protein DFH09DRAFT_1179052 [Mycena vulgaris]|nr:hypothetical protein DFH09DRAFT_1179052 [Mycena vulgaris]